MSWRDGAGCRIASARKATSHEWRAYEEGGSQPTDPAQAAEPEALAALPDDHGTARRGVLFRPIKPTLRLDADPSPEGQGYRTGLNNALRYSMMPKRRHGFLGDIMRHLI